MNSEQVNEMNWTLGQRTELIEQRSSKIEANQNQLNRRRQATKRLERNAGLIDLQDRSKPNKTKPASHAALISLFAIILRLEVPEGKLDEFPGIVSKLFKIFSLVNMSRFWPGAVCV